MDTTPQPDSTVTPPRPELDRLSQADPADAPDIAEALAADLGLELEAAGGDAAPRQLEAPLEGDPGEPGS
jgi:hypothetical protein